MLSDPFPTSVVLPAPELGPELGPGSAPARAPIPRVIATVDRAALQHNLRVVRRLAPASRVMAAIKADGYGHGAVPVAGALAEAGVDAFAVACLEEALALRAAGIDGRIALLEGVLSAEEAAEAVRQRLEIVVHAGWQLALLDALPVDAEFGLWFKLDSGMHRLGFPLAEVGALHDWQQKRAGRRLQGWITHLACADDRNDPMTRRQIAAYEAAIAGRPGERSIANSAGLIAWPEARTDWVRPGLMLYGASPVPDQRADALGLRPAMTVHSRLIAVHRVAAGEPIGYGATYRCPEAMPVGVVAVGYADGVHRILPTGAPVLIHGQRAAIIGRVSMDMITVDLRGLPTAAVGDPVTLWGEGLPVEEVAAWAGTLAYELLCGLTSRVHYRYV